MPGNHVVAKRRVNAAIHGFAIAEREWMFALEYFKKYPHENKIWRKQVKNLNAKLVIRHMQICRIMGMNCEQSIKFLEQFDHSFYQHPETKDIIAIKGKHHYQKTTGLARDDAELIPHGSYGKFRIGISYQTGDVIGVKIEGVNDDNDVLQKKQEVALTKSLMGQGAYLVRQRARPEKLFLKRYNERYKFVSFVKYIDGITLDQWLQSPRSLFDKLSVAIQLCSQLHQIHMFNVVHNDIHMGNIMVDKNNQPYIIDYSLMAVLPQGAHCHTHAVGIDGYKSPQKAKFYCGSFDSDIWALMVVFFRMLGLDCNNKSFFTRLNLGSQQNLSWFVRFVESAPTNFDPVLNCLYNNYFTKNMHQGVLLSTIQKQLKIALDLEKIHINTRAKIQAANSIEALIGILKQDVTQLRNSLCFLLDKQKIIHYLLSILKSPEALAQAVTLRDYGKPETATLRNQSGVTSNYDLDTKIVELAKARLEATAAPKPLAEATAAPILNQFNISQQAKPKGQEKHANQRSPMRAV